jgi:hypothetical protein
MITSPGLAEFMASRVVQMGGKSIVFALPVQHEVSGLQFISLLFFHLHLAPD